MEVIKGLVYRQEITVPPPKGHDRNKYFLSFRRRWTL